MAAPVLPIGFCSISALDRSLAEAARVAAEAGLDGLEVTARPPHLDPDAGSAAARDAGRVVRDHGLEVVCYGAYLGRMGRLTDEHARQDAALAAALGAPRMRVWAEPLEQAPGDRTPAVELIRVACDAAAEHGIDVVVERHLGSFCERPDQIEETLAAIDRPNVALNWQVLDNLPPETAPAQPADARRLAARARYVHLKNFRFDPATPAHLQFGGAIAAGAFDYRAILRELVGAGYRGPLTIEFLSAEWLPLEQKLASEAAFIREVLRECGLP